MEVRISSVKDFRELYVRVETVEYKVLSSSLDSLADRIILQVELTKEVVEDAGKDDKAPVDNSGRQSLCQCGICRANREGSQGSEALYRPGYGPSKV